MALRAIDVGTREAPGVAPTLRTPALAPTLAPALATLHQLRPAPRVATFAAQRRERRRWLVIGGVVFGSPFVACVCVLGVVR